ncbi:cytoplasmic protein [Coprinopsis cinerea okayama7|uniref:Cytoplasmic protein n=1 Tax=Coprinopsis cinerea (strain Okayama-7 / 130 / ATCC MYA-4618 / FGSC 9003) TaxID=240176 RepID=A8N9W2_COPC7|nr:cytoplasmic protein [Coprinopsis cinerea okayama7\|eukprot:XP_001831618.1 cytoplasmic protein [Coprinopsis cinerea okayama7\
MASLQRSQQYHVFSLPQEFLDTLTLRNLVNQPPVPSPPSPEPLITSTSQRACGICLGVTFRDVDEQRLHFKSDWHRYNVKMKMNGGKPVTEANFNQLVDGLELDDSLSGSASSSDEDDEDSDAVNALVNKTKQLGTRSPSPDAARQAPQTALAWFHSPPSTQIGVYRALFPLKTEPSDYLDALRNLQTPKSGGRTWAVFMVAGGHFAGALVRVSKDADEEDEDDTSKSKKKPKKPKPDIEVLRHKTFHRYTTRRKQGGSQSVNDNAKGPAKSAGAQLRRYGEQALREDIRNLLSDWAEDIDECERIWIRANTSNRRIFLDYDEAVIRKGDDRLRTFPFPTRRPTQSELTRCLNELTKVKITHFTEDELKAQDDAYLASLPKPKPVPTAPSAPTEREKPQPVKLSKEEELLRDKWSRLLEMVSKGRLEPLKSFWEREKDNIGGIDTPIPEWAHEKVTTLLQLAASAGHVDVVQWLLESARADPTIPVGAPGSKQDGLSDATDPATQSDAGPSHSSVGPNRTAYDLSKTKAVRDVFRRVAATHLDWWDWLGAGHIPSVLSQDMEDEQEQKKKVRRKGLKDKVKEREAREREKQQERPASPPVDPAPAPKKETLSNAHVHRLGGSAGSTEGIAGLTPEMRMRVERERRARAAEARLKAMAGGK